MMITAVGTIASIPLMSDGAAGGAILGGMAVYSIIVIGYLVWFLWAMARLFPLIGLKSSDGWIPIWNQWKLLERAGLPGWIVLLVFTGFLSFVPFICLVVAMHRIGTEKGAGAGYTVLGFFLPPLWATLLANHIEAGGSAGGAASQGMYAPQAAFASQGVDNTRGVNALSSLPGVSPGAAQPASAASSAFQSPVAPGLAPQPFPHPGQPQPGPPQVGAPPLPPFPQPSPSQFGAPPPPPLPPAPIAPPAPAAPEVPSASPLLPGGQSPFAPQVPSQAPAPTAPPLPPAHSAPPASPVPPAPPVPPVHPVPPVGVNSDVSAFAPPLPPAPPVAPVPPAPSVGANSGVSAFAPPQVPGFEGPQPVEPLLQEAQPSVLPISASPIPAAPPVPQPTAADISAADSTAADIDETFAADQAVQEPAHVVPDPAPSYSAESEAAEEDLDRTVVVPRAVERWVLELPGGEEVELSRDSIVGRRPDAADGAVAVALFDPTRTLSKAHARLRFENGVWTIDDLGSTNGVFLIEADGTERELQVGAPEAATAEMLLGQLRVRLRRGGESE